MLLKNCTYFDDAFELKTGDILINGDIIESLEQQEQNGTDMSDYIVLPGFTDIHTHGAMGSDASDKESDAVIKMSEFLITKGVTSFCPTTMTLPEDELVTAFKNCKTAKGKEPGAKICGINMEGPFISESKKGAQKAEYIRKPDIELYNKLNGICNICLTDIAPECDEDFNYSNQASKTSVVSIAHTSANWQIASESFGNGVTHATHLFNAMSQFSSREPGVVGAVFDSNSVTAELICDGIHIAAPTLRTAFRILGENRSVIISDSIRATGLKSGIYTLGGQDVIVKNDARLPDGTLAGSITNLFDEMNYLLKIGVDLKQVIKSLTINPARVIGLNDKIGSIKPGKKADLTIVSKDFSKIINVISNGIIKF